ncbi:MAG: energy transducer TonB [Nitrospina sp.]|jgi:periplasmic protein TonB|nr:energy transducer TonB [Nitrospina sp.]MBT5631716.1 energy transducer TonB [Nitrospina sp.]
MPNSWLKNNLLNRTRLTGFILISLAIHFMLVIVHMMNPVSEKVEKGPPPIQVKYVESEKPKASKSSRIIDTPLPPKKIEKARTKELQAKYDSRAHSNTSAKTSKTYQRKKTVVPKSKGSRENPGIAPVRKNKVVRKPKTQSKVESPKRNLPESDIGKFKTLTRKKTTPSTSSSAPKAGTGSALALLDGFDPEKFASLDTKNLENSDDDEPVSLDTTEVKYASYFARIKHQIERVWIYPSDAAKRGISGDLNLTFSISKDGNLLGARLLDRSGYEILDMAALKAVKEAAPFYPFPANIQREKLTIQANFIYTPNLESIAP